MSPTRTILHLTGMRSTKYGALEAYFVHLARACRARGFRSVFQYNSVPSSESFLAALREAGGEIDAPPAGRVRPTSAVEVLRAVLRWRPEIVHAHFVMGAALSVLPWAGALGGARRVLVTWHSDPRRPDGGVLVRALSRAAIRAGCNRCSRVLAVSNGVRSRLIELGVRRDRVEVLYLGLVRRSEASPALRAQHRREMHIPERAPVFACIAFDSPIKGLDVLLPAFQGVVADPAPHLLVIGVDPGRSRLPAMAEALGISSRVHWAGIRDNGAALLAAADVYVQPSRAEGLNLSCTEAMALGLPVVATRVCGMDEVMVEGRTGLLAEPGDPESLRVELQRTLDDAATARALGDEGRARFDRLFDGARSIATLVDRYYELEPMQHPRVERTA